jgi:hypothetical protein
VRRHVRFNVRGHVCRDMRIDMRADLLNYLRRPYLCLDVLRYLFRADMRLDLRCHMRCHMRCDLCCNLWN